MTQKTNEWDESVWVSVEWINKLQLHNSENNIETEKWLPRYDITGSNRVYNDSYTWFGKNKWKFGKWKGYHILQPFSQLHDETRVSDCFRESNKEILITKSALVKAIICALVRLPLI